MESDSGQQAVKDKRLVERQAHVSRLVSSYRDEAKQLLRDVLRAQNRWCRELEDAVFVGLPGLERPPKTGGHYVRRRLPWRPVERDALRRCLMGLGIGRWREIHAALSNSIRGFRHGPGDVEDACWHMLLESQLMLQAPEDRLYLARVMESIGDRGPVTTPGAPFGKIHGAAKSIVRRLMLLEELNALMPGFMRSEAVVGIFRALATKLPASALPAAWWDVEADVAVMVGVHRHGYNNYESIRKDPALQKAFQGCHAAAEQKNKPESTAASPALPDPIDGSEAEGAAADHLDVQAAHTGEHATDAAGTGQVKTWPSAEALSKRVRMLCDLVAQSVALAEAHGLLLPAVEAPPGPSYEKQGTKVECKLTGILPYGTTAAAAAVSVLDLQIPTAGTSAALEPGEGFRSAQDSPGLPHALSGQLDEAGAADDFMGELASPLDKVDHAQYAGGYGQEEEEEDDQYEDDEDTGYSEGMAAAAAPGFGSFFSTGWQTRGRVGRPRKGSQRASTTDAAAAAAATTTPPAAPASDAGDGRRRHRPNKRFADAVLLDVEPGDAAYNPNPSQGEAGGHEVSKKARRELLNLVLTWGLPDPTSDMGDVAATSGSDPVAAAVAMAAAGADYDWDNWAGAGGLTGPLQKMNTPELTLMLRELLAEMDELVSAGSAAAAAGLNKVRNAHQPNCDCIVCTNRRNAEQRKKEAAGVSDAAAAAAETPEPVDTAAAKAAVAPLPKGEVLTVLTASRLQERLELMALFRSVVGLSGHGQLEAAFKKGAKDLPNWWSPQLDVALIAGVVTHGYGNWGPIFEDENLPFKAAAAAAGAAGVDFDPSDPAAAAALGDAAIRSPAAKAKAGLPDWVPDPKVLTKRCKTLTTTIKSKVVGAKGVKAKGEDVRGMPGDHDAAGSGKGKGGKGKGGKGAGGSAGQRGGAAQSISPSAGSAMGMHGQMGQVGATAPLQMQQMAAMGYGGMGGAAGTSSALQQILAQRFGGGSAATAGMNPAALQQHQQQLSLLQQQQLAGQGAVKRSAAAAGLPDSSQPMKAAAGQADLGPAGAAVVDAATFAAVVAAAAPSLTPGQIAVLERLPKITRDASGSPVLPLSLTASLTLLALGKIETSRPAFHTREHIFPIGLQTSVQYPSIVQQGADSKYTCVVADGAVAGAAGPVFLVVTADAPGRQWLTQSPQTVWQQIHGQAQQTQQVVLPPVDGYQQFGLSHPLVAMLIQELPGAQQCTGYEPAESCAPPQMVTAMRQLQKAMTDKTGPQYAQQSHGMQVEAAASSARRQAAHSDQQPAAVLQATTAQQQILQAQMLQQQMLRMQQAGQGQPLQQQPAAAVSATGSSAGAGPQQQQQVLQMLQQKAIQQQQLLQQQQQQQQVPAAAAANPAVLQRILLLQQQQRQQLAQQQAQQQPMGVGAIGSAGNVTAQQAALLQQAVAARAANLGVAGGAQQQGQQMLLTPQQLQQQQQQQMLLRQALATGLQQQQQQQHQQPHAGN